MNREKLPSSDTQRLAGSALGVIGGAAAAFTIPANTSNGRASLFGLFVLLTFTFPVIVVIVPDSVFKKDKKSADIRVRSFRTPCIIMGAVSVVSSVLAVVWIKPQNWAPGIALIVAFALLAAGAALFVMGRVSLAKQRLTQAGAW